MVPTITTRRFYKNIIIKKFKVNVKITRNPPITETANRAVWKSHGQLAQHGYSRRGNFNGSLVHNIFLIYLPDGTNVYGSRTMDFEGSGLVQTAEGWKFFCCKIMFLGAFLIHLFRHFCCRLHHLASLLCLSVSDAMHCHWHRKMTLWCQ